MPKNKFLISYKYFTRLILQITRHQRRTRVSCITRCDGGANIFLIIRVCFHEYFILPQFVLGLTSYPNQFSVWHWSESRRFLQSTTVFPGKFDLWSYFKVKNLNFCEFQKLSEYQSLFINIDWRVVFHDWIQFFIASTAIFYQKR